MIVTCVTAGHCFISQLTKRAWKFQQLWQHCGYLMKVGNSISKCNHDSSMVCLSCVAVQSVLTVCPIWLTHIWEEATLILKPCMEGCWGFEMELAGCVLCLRLRNRSEILDFPECITMASSCSTTSWNLKHTEFWCPRPGLSNDD